MAFQIKDFASITASMLNWMRSTQKKITDFRIGSTVRTMLEAVAIELDELYQQMFIGLKEAIPVSVYHSFDFEEITDQAASGQIRVTISSSTDPILILAGTKCTVAGSSVTYMSNADVTIPPGSTFGDIIVTATTTGSVGNLVDGQSFTLSPAPQNFVSATNAAAFANGVDQETPDQRKLRFQSFIQSLARGTPLAIKYGLTEETRLTDAVGNVTERVVYAEVYEPWLTDEDQPISLVKCYIHNGVGGTSNDLVLQARKVVYGYYDDLGNAVPGWKAAGVNVEVYAATELPINVAGTLTALPGYEAEDLEADANSAAAAYIAGLPIKARFQVADLIAEVKKVAGVDNFIPADVAPPAAPVLASTAGGALSATTYYARVTYLTAQGETVVSPITSLAVAANRLLTIAAPAAKTGIIGWNVYVGTSSGSLQKQNSAMLNLATSYTEPTSGLVSGAVPPASSTARFVDLQSSYFQKFMPGTIGIGD